MTGRAVVAVFAPWYPPAFRGGGPIRSLYKIVPEAPDGFETWVVTRDRDLGASEPLVVTRNAWVMVDSARVRYTTISSLRWVVAALVSLRGQRPSVLYFNSFFDPMMSILPQLLARFGWWRGARRLMAVRGEFGGPALQIRPTKKRAYIAVYRLLGLHKGVIWHATSEEEADNVRSVFGKRCKIVVRADGGAPLVVADTSEFALRSGPVRLAFLSRIVPKKGLEEALISMATLKAAVSLDIWGPDEDVAYVERCRAAAAALPSNVTARFHGAVDPIDIPQLLSSCDAFLMPTWDENFGHVIGEALASGLPVLIRDVTPWTPFVRKGEGIIVPRSDGWAAAIESFCARTPEERLRARHASVAAYRSWEDARPSVHLFDAVAEALKTP